MYAIFHTNLQGIISFGKIYQIKETRSCPRPLKGIKILRSQYILLKLCAIELRIRSFYTFAFQRIAEVSKLKISQKKHHL